MESLLQRLPEGPLDIIGDVHGEYDALCALLTRLGCRLDSLEPARPLVFVGDLCDRGPDSVRVVQLVASLVRQGRAYCVLGNHEFNLMRLRRKEGNGWSGLFEHEDGFQDPAESGAGVLLRHPFRSCRASSDEISDILDFFGTIPLALEREELRVVHAQWSNPEIEQLRAQREVLRFDAAAMEDLGRRLGGLLDEEREELRAVSLSDPSRCPSMHALRAHVECERARELASPVRVALCGREDVVTGEPFFAGGKWRVMGRTAWWESYEEQPAVVVGHYWRERHTAAELAAGFDAPPDGWPRTLPGQWQGPRRNVFCVDFSVGKRYLERHRGVKGAFRGALAALRWPERELVFDAP
ncbi:MAG: metallophosphoesterase [Myxococcota bacterium]|jgi:hypothetical protein|nr:metallophosphoesterase [Myxococcota bacterium]